MNHILVVDDDPSIRIFLTLALQEEGHAVETAADGIEALEILDRSTPSVVLLDLLMPRLDGAGVVRSLREQGQEVPILLMSVDIDAQRSREMGADGFLLKPFSLDDLFDAIQRVRKGD